LSYLTYIKLITGIICLVSLFLIRFVPRKSPLYMKYWGFRKRRTHKTVEAVLRHVNDTETASIVCDVPTIKRRAVIRVKDAAFYQKFMETEEEPVIELELFRLSNANYLLDGRSYGLRSLTGNELGYLDTIQTERATVAKCRTMREIGVILMLMALVVSISVPGISLLLWLTGAVFAGLNQTFADDAIWNEMCSLDKIPVQESEDGTRDELPEDYANWSVAERFIYHFKLNYDLEYIFSDKYAEVPVQETVENTDEAEQQDIEEGEDADIPDYPIEEKKEKENIAVQEEPVDTASDTKSVGDPEPQEQSADVIDDNTKEPSNKEQIIGKNPMKDPFGRSSKK